MVKFGFGQIPMDLASTLSFVSLAEKLEYDYAWMPDQTFYRDPYVMLGAAALKTTKIQLGVGVTNPYTRHPAMTARAVATVDELSGGRMNLGIGSGNRDHLLNPIGFKRKNVAPMCRDAVIIIKKLFKGETVTHNGKVVAKGVKLDFKVPRDIPIYIAARGPKLLEVAGEVADGVIIGALVGKKGLDYAFKQINKGLEKSGRSLNDIDIVSWVRCTMTDNKKEFIRKSKAGVANFHIMRGGSNAKTLKLIGIGEEAIENVKRAYEKGEPSKAIEYIPDEVVEELNVYGTAQECADKIEWLFQNGIKQFAFLTGGRDLAHMKGTLENFASEIISKFR